MLLDGAEMARIGVQAAQALGWTRLEYNHSGRLVGSPPGKKMIRPVPAYADDIKAAWEIAEHLAIRGIAFKIELRTLAGPVRNYFVEIIHGPAKVRANHFRAPAALCLAIVRFFEERRIDSGDVVS